MYSGKEKKMHVKSFLYIYCLLRTFCLCLIAMPANCCKPFMLQLYPYAINYYSLWFVNALFLLSIYTLYYSGG